MLKETCDKRITSKESRQLTISNDKDKNSHDSQSAPRGLQKGVQVSDTGRLTVRRLAQSSSCEVLRADRRQAGGEGLGLLGPTLSRESDRSHPPGEPVGNYYIYNRLFTLSIYTWTIRLLWPVYRK